MNKVARMLAHLLGILVLFPLLITVSHSFMSVRELIYSYPQFSNEVTGYSEAFFHIIPNRITLSGYTQLLLGDTSYIGYYCNTIAIVIPIIVGQVSVSILAAYGLLNSKSVLKKRLVTLFVCLAVMPFQILVVPNYLLFDKLDLLDTWHALYLPGIFSTVGVVLLIPFIYYLPYETVEAARLDGANELQVLYKVVIPQVKSGIIFVSLFLFIDYWNMIEQPEVFIQDAQIQPLSLYLGTISRNNFQLGFSGAVLYMIPVLFIYIGCSNYLKDRISKSE